MWLKIQNVYNVKDKRNYEWYERRRKGMRAKSGLNK